MVSSAFTQAMDTTNHISIGENGAAEYSDKGVQESRLALFFALVRGLQGPRLAELIKFVVSDARVEENPDIIADIFLMAFQTRHCRGGKGERDLFYKMILELALLYPQTTESLMSLVPHYGSFKDWFQLVAIVTEGKGRGENGGRGYMEGRGKGGYGGRGRGGRGRGGRGRVGIAYNDKIDPKVRQAMIPITNTIMDLAVEQLLKDLAALEKIESSESASSSNSSHGISLLAKWAPRENKQFQKQATLLANKLFPGSKAPKKEYRQLLSRLNRAIDSCEVKMSSNKWANIEFEKVPSICLMKHRKAFLNEKIGTPPSTFEEEETGNRHPFEYQRKVCRKRLRDVMLNSKVQKLKGRQLFPHEIIKKFMQYDTKLSILEEQLLSCQWSDIRANVLSAMSKLDLKSVNSQEESTGVDLGKTVPIVDVSGSMRGIPMEVAIALGILVSEITEPSFANRCLTFSESPSWIELDSCKTLQEKTKKVMESPWGMSTDFEKATELLLQIAIKAKLKPDEIPDLIVFSDMQFDIARNTSGGWETHHERIVRRFKEEGIKACGVEWPAPHIIYWNLRGDTNGFPAQGNTPNVTMLSGFSPSLLKLLLAGEAMEMEIGERDTADAQRNPFLTMRRALDAEDYNKVKLVLSESKEGLLQKYKASDDILSSISKKVDTMEDEWEVV